MLDARSNDATSSAAPTLAKSGGRGPKPLGEIIVDGLLTVTPELAHRIIQTGKFDRQRPIRAKHVDALATQMRRREWTSGTQIHFGRTPNGELHLVNGQHRMHAIIKADTAIKFQVLVTDVESDKALIHLYRRHDRLIAPRTISDALAAEGIPAAHGLRSQMANAVFKAVLVIDARFTRRGDPYLSRSDEARLRMAEEWWAVAVSFQEMTDAAPAQPIKRYLTNAGAMSVALLTVRHQPEIADIFWRGLAENDGLAKVDPRAVLLRHIYAAAKGRSEIGTAKAVSYAWNAAYEGRNLDEIRIRDGAVTILGTPFDKPKKKA